jgi:hypothetical protein
MAFQRTRTDPYYGVDANDPDQILNEDGLAYKGRRTLGENELKLNAAVAELAARVGRVDPTITVRFVEPWSLKPKPREKGAT